MQQLYPFSLVCFSFENKPESWSEIGAVTQQFQEETSDTNVLVCLSDRHHPSKKLSSSWGSHSSTDGELFSYPTGCLLS